MTVEELIKELQKQNPKATVTAGSYYPNVKGVIYDVVQVDTKEVTLEF